MFAPLILLGLGAASVLQGGLNRQLLNSMGLAKVALMNNFVLFLASILFFMLQPSAPAAVSLRSFNPLLLILPGVLGLSLVAGIPWAIGRWGAGFVFIGLISSQVLSSLVWDFCTGAQAFDWKKGISLLLAIGSAIFMMGGAA